MTGEGEKGTYVCGAHGDRARGHGTRAGAEVKLLMRQKWVMIRGLAETASGVKSDLR